VAANPVPVLLVRYRWFPSGGKFVFAIIGKSKAAGEVVISRSYRYNSQIDVINAAKVARGRNTEIPIVGPAGEP
jgi:hypothetical protein